MTLRETVPSLPIGGKQHVPKVSGMGDWAAC